MNKTIYHRQSLMLLASALLVATLIACSQSQLPIDLVGVWVTEHEHYQQCYLDIDEDSIVFGNEKGATEAGIVRKVTLTQKDPPRIFDVQYETEDGGVFTLHIVFSSENGGTLWFEHQPQVVWRRLLPCLNIIHRSRIT